MTTYNYHVFAAYEPLPLLKRLVWDGIVSSQSPLDNFDALLELKGNIMRLGHWGKNPNRVVIESLTLLSVKEDKPSGEYKVQEMDDGTYWVVHAGRRIAHVDTFDPFSPDAKAYAEKIADALNS